LINNVRFITSHIDTQLVRKPYQEKEKLVWTCFDILVGTGHRSRRRSDCFQRYVFNGTFPYFYIQ